MNGESSSRATQERHARAAGPTGDLGGEQGVVDGPRVDRGEEGAEQVAALLEEGPPLRIEQGQGRVDVDLGGVGLDLAEVRVDRGLDRQARRERSTRAPSDASPRIGPLSNRLPSRAADLGHDLRRQQLDALAGLHAADAREGAPLAGPAVQVAVVGGPGVLPAAPRAGGCARSRRARPARRGRGSAGSTRGWPSPPANRRR